MPANLFDSVAVLLVLAASFGYLNHRLLRLPFAIGLTVSGLLASGAMLAIDAAFPALGLAAGLRTELARVDFTEALLHGMLSFLLFAGALHVDLELLVTKLRAIATLATFGVLLSAAVVGGCGYYVFAWAGVPVPLLHCLVFGALIAPTDPVAVLGIMRAARAEPSHEVKVVGESLLNDGVGVVLFTILLHVAVGEGQAIGAAEIAIFVLREVAGGLAIGLLGGFVAYLAMRTLDQPNLEILISVALVMGVSVAAYQLHASAPLACVAAGLLIGNRGRRLAMSERTRVALDVVWGFIDEALNAILFLLIGLEVLTIEYHPAVALASAAMVPLVLLARLISVALPIQVLSRFEEFTPGAVMVLTWSGLRGGISVALALSLPAMAGRDVILAATYAVVVFSIVVQGLTVGRLVRWIARVERRVAH